MQQQYPANLVVLSLFSGVLVPYLFIFVCMCGQILLYVPVVQGASNLVTGGSFQLPVLESLQVIDVHTSEGLGKLANTQFVEESNSGNLQPGMLSSLTDISCCIFLYLAYSYRSRL